MKVLTLTLLALFAVAATPTVVADDLCTGAASESICYSESYDVNGTCTDGYVTGLSSLEYRGMVADASFVGFSSCFGMSQFGFTGSHGGIILSANTEVGGASVSWHEFQLSQGGSQTRYCQMDVSTSATGSLGTGGCPVGGPPSGIPWGQLLP